MANVKKNQKAVAPEATAETTTEQTGEVAQNEAAVAVTEAPATEATAKAAEVAAETKKRERSYSQSAINTEDLERLNQLKTFVKEKLKVNVSNQRIISAALDCLGDNVEAFLKGIAAEVNDKQLAKDRKAYDLLKSKFEAAEHATFAEIKAELDAAEALVAE